MGSTSSAIKLQSCAITSGIKKYKSIIKKKEKKHEKIVFLAKTNLSSIEVVICKVLTDSYINHDEVVLVNDVINEYDDMKEKNQKFKNFIT